jgi:hypothetical protein
MTDGNLSAGEAITGSYRDSSAARSYCKMDLSQKTLVFGGVTVPKFAAVQSMGFAAAHSRDLLADGNRTLTHSCRALQTDQAG